MIATLAALFGVLTLGLLSPGPDFLLILRNSLGPSRSRGLGTAAGIVTGLALQTFAIALGFAALPPAAMRWLQFAGAAYLAYLGLRALLPPAAAVAAPNSEDALSCPDRDRKMRAVPDARSGFVDGLVCNLTNPKAFLFFVGLFAQVAPPGAALGWRIGLPIGIVVHGALLWTLVVFALRSPPVAGRLARAQHWLPRAFGVALLVLAAWILRGALGV